MWRSKNSCLFESNREIYSFWSKYHNLPMRLWYNSLSIIDCVNNYIKDHDVQIIVIFDYLQKFLSMNYIHNAKEAINYHLWAFNKFHVENDLVVLLISRLNSSNYLMPIFNYYYKLSSGKYYFLKFNYFFR